MMDFDHILSLVAPYTMLDEPRLRGLYEAVCSAVEANIPGDVVECGTARGGSAALMGLALDLLRAGRVLWVFDTFEGIPAATGDDPPDAMQFTGQFKGEYEQVKGLFREFGILDNSRLIKGLFQNTLHRLGAGEIAVLHLDGDWYESTKCGLEALYDKVAPGGFIQIDDYGHWAGCRKAVDEFFQARGLQPELTWLDYTGVQFKKGEGKHV
jgi:Macrocin-O-methyltransferase (TylF)